jgi:glycosyltransferase involved in cell wall biosynthesis
VHRHLEFYGGAENIVVKLASYLNKKGIENSIVALSPLPSYLKESKELDIIIPKKKFRHKLRAISIRDSFETLSEIRALRSIVRRIMHHYDVINPHNFPATWSFFPNHKPSVWMLNEPIGLWHNVNPSIGSKMLNNILTTMDRFVVNRYIDIVCVADEFNANRFHTIYGRRAEIVPYGIEYDIFSNGHEADVVQKFNLDASFVIIQVGQITSSKNQFASVKAVEQLKEQIPSVKLVLAGVGDPPYEKRLRDYIREKKLERNVIFTGHVPKYVVSDLYHASDVAVFPVESQGGFLSPFEALCASKPIIVSTRITAKSIIEKAGIGLVSDDLVSSILDVYKNPKHFTKMAEKGKRFVTENLTFERYGHRMLELFEMCTRK